jgi:hypothetical protein
MIDTTRLSRRIAKRPAAAVMLKIRSRSKTFRDTELLPLVLLKSDECRWPVVYDARALGNHLFCGQKTDGRSYCAKHQRFNLSKRKD